MTMQFEKCGCAWIFTFEVKQKLHLICIWNSSILVWRGEKPRVLLVEFYSGECESWECGGERGRERAREGSKLCLGSVAVRLLCCVGVCSTLPSLTASPAPKGNCRRPLSQQIYLQTALTITSYGNYWNPELLNVLYFTQLCTRELAFKCVVLVRCYSKLLFNTYMTIVKFYRRQQTKIWTISGNDCSDMSC